MAIAEVRRALPIRACICDCSFRGTKCGERRPRSRALAPCGGWGVSRVRTFRWRRGLAPNGDSRRQESEAPVSEALRRDSLKHLDAYLNELEWRFNNRENPFLFRDTLRKLVSSDNIEYKVLTA